MLTTPLAHPSRSLLADTISLLLATTLSGCAITPSQPDLERLRTLDEQSQPAIRERLLGESEKLRESQQQLREEFEQTTPAPAPVAPPPAPVNPLDGIKVTLVVEDGDARAILRAVARQAELNVVLPDSLRSEPQLLSLELREMPASQVLAVITEELDMSATVSDRLIEVRSHQERIFHLDFLQTVSHAGFEAGGDVFGAGAGSDLGDSGGSVSGLTSSFTIQGRNTNTSDPYEQIEQMITTLLRSGESEQSVNRSHHILNRNTGTLWVRARPSRMATIEQLIQQYQAVSRRQVLIEAQILDVELSDEFRYGVNWSHIQNTVATLYGGGVIEVSGLTAQIPRADGSPRTITIPGSSAGVNRASPGLGLLYARDNHTLAVDLLRTFGTVHVLSNPSLRVRNSQPAVVSVGSNERFVRQISSSVSQAGGGQTTTTADVVTGNLFDGVQLGVIPFIGDDGTISMLINPMQTIVQPGSSEPRAIGGGEGGLSISLPKVDFKGLTTSLSLRDGDLVILGGLISEGGSRSKDGIPPFSEVPILEQIFGGHARTTRARELVLALRVTLL